MHISVSKFVLQHNLKVLRFPIRVTMDLCLIGENPDKLKNDEELKQWGKQLNAPLSQAGSGIEVQS